MTRNVNERAREYGRWHRFHTRWGRLLSVMACVVVFCTTYALILPAITLDQQTYCGQEEHTHTLEECYVQELICTDESPEHVHSDVCYISALTCQIPEHQHSEACYEAPEETTAAEETPVVETETAQETASSAQVLALTEQTVTAAVYTDESYTAAYAEPVTITLQGNLPEGVAVKAYPVTVTVNGKEAVEAYDIALFITDMNGEAVEYEPDSAVQVTITSDNLQDLNSVNVYHIDDADEANPDPQPELVTEGTAVSEENQIAFSAEKFSIYAVEGAEGSDGTSLASISGSKTVEQGSTITLYCSSNCKWGTWTSSDTSIATVTTGDKDSSSTTLTGVSAGTVTVKHTHKSYGYDVSAGSYDVTVTAKTYTTESAKVYFLKTPTSDPDSNETSEWSSEVGEYAAKVNMNGAVWEDNGKNVKQNVGSYVVSMPSGFVKQDDGSYLMPKSQYYKYYQEIANGGWAQEWKISADDIEAVYLTPYKISTNQDGMHIDCKIGVKVSGVYSVEFWIISPDGSKAQLDSWTERDTTTDNPSISETTKTYDKTITNNGVTYVFDGWYPESGYSAANNTFSGGTVTWDYTATDADMKDGTVFFYAHYIPATKDITIVKYASGDKSTLLGGAVFTLSDIDGTYTTDQYGQVTINDVPYGTYTLTETTAPNNYAAMNGTVSVTVGDTISINAGSTRAAYENGVIYVPNELLKIDFTLKKVDSTDGTKALSGAEFTLSGDGIADQKVDTDANGTATFKDIPKGTYTLTETKAPDGYNILTDTITITVENGVVKSEGNSVSQDTDGAYVVTVKNSAGTTLPVTGGPGTTLYTLSGLMLVAIATVGGLKYGGKLRKKGVTR